MQIKRHAATVLASSLFALAAAAHAQTVIVPADGDQAVTPQESQGAVIVPGRADTILIVTPNQDATAVRDDSLPANRADVRAETRDAVQQGMPRGEQNWPDQTTHRQSGADPDLPSTHDNP